MYSITKRIADFSVAAAGLIVLSPLILPIVIGLRFTGEGEIFYRQERLGYKRRLFGIFKFATMLKNSPNIGTGDITLRNDPRVTPMGNWLRRTKINELPQILNVLLGDLSLVGPRPLMPVSFSMYTNAIQTIIYDSKPGITGIGSLVYRDEEALVSSAVNAGINAREYYENVIYPYKGELEMWYYYNKGLIVDCKILIGTTLSILDSKTDWANKLFSKLPNRPDSFASNVHLVN